MAGLGIPVKLSGFPLCVRRDTRVGKLTRSFHFPAIGDCQRGPVPACVDQQEEILFLPGFRTLVIGLAEFAAQCISKQPLRFSLCMDF